jgi:uncharacterized membrane protein YfcA
MIDYLSYFLLTLSFSTLFAIVGVGSSLALIPLFSIMGMDFNSAKMLGLVANGVTTSFVTIKNILAKNIDYKFVIPLVVLTSFFAIFGAGISRFIDELIVQILFVSFIFLSMFFMFGVLKDNNKHYKFSKFQLYFIISVIALVAGLLGVGGGAFYLPFLIYIGYSTKNSISSVSTLIPFISFSAFYMYSTYVPIDWVLLFIVSIGAILGGFIGQKIMYSIENEYYLKIFISGILILISFLMIYKKLGYG